MTKHKNFIIGILGHIHKGSTTGYGQNAAYIEYFRTFGDVLILDAQSETVFDIDLLVLPGGRDVNPLRYNKPPELYTQPPDLEYEWFFTKMFPKYMEKVTKKEMAVYGICAGFQNLIVEFGGILEQDYPQKQSTNFRGDLVDYLDINENFMKNSFFKDIYNLYKNKADFKETNSIHHQAVLVKNTPDCFEIIATNRTYDNVEFIIHKDYPIAAEQSHPEERVNPLLTNQLIRNLLKMIK